MFYGPGKEGKGPEGVAVSVDPKAVLRILHSDSGANTLINLKLEGLEARVMVREYQLDPVTHHLLHADFYQLAMDKAIVVTVPIVVKGEAKGVKQQSGMLDFVTREIEVECLPTDIPENIMVDVSELMLHESIRVRDLAGGSQVEGGQRGRHDARARRDAEGRRGAGGGDGRRGGADGSGDGRARSHQEGQDRREGRREEEVEAGLQTRLNS